MDFEKIYKELIKIIAEKHGVIVKTTLIKKDSKKKDVKNNGTVQTSN